MQNVDPVLARSIENLERIRTTATTRTCERRDRRGADSGAPQMRSTTSSSRRSISSAIAGLALAEYQANIRSRSANARLEYASFMPADI
jgi:hypothetical protein